MKYIHIAGTNAKGSVAEYLCRMFMAEGISLRRFYLAAFVFADRAHADGRTGDQSRRL